MKKANIPDPRIPGSLQKLMFRGSEFMPQHQEKIDSLIEDARENFDLPFDELYHKQKKVIQDVIEAEKAL